MTVLHTGSTQKFADNWQSIFGSKPPRSTAKTAVPKKSNKKKAASPKKKATSTAKKRPIKKKAGKKR